MIEEYGRVISTDGVHALVETRRGAGGCTACSDGRGCGVASLATWFGRRRIRVQASDPVGTRAGDEVVLGIEAGGLLRAALLAYVLPILAMLAPALAAAALGGAEATVIVAGLAGLAAGIAAGRRVARRMARSDGYRPRILRRAVSRPL